MTGRKNKVIKLEVGVPQLMSVCMVLYFRVILFGCIFFLFCKLLLKAYQYNTGSHRIPISHGSLDPEFLDGRGSTSFGSQSDLSTSCKALIAVN